MEWSITVWDAPRLAYITVPKAANTAVKAALLSSYVRKQKWRNPHAATMPYVEVTKDELRDRYADYLSFTVVRNPFDRFVSFWADKIAGHGWYESLRRRGFAPGMGFEESAKVAASISDADTDPHLRSQHERLTDADGTLLPHLVLRFEDLHPEWEGLRSIANQRAGPRLVALEQRRESIHLPSERYFTPAAIDAVTTRYRQDFELLGYPTSLEGAGSAEPDDALHRLHRSVSGRDGVIVVDAIAPDLVRRDIVRSAGGVYLSVAVGSRPEGQVSSVGTTVRAIGDDAPVLIVHRGSAGSELTALSSHAELLQLD